MNATTTKALTYSFQGKTIWLEAGTQVNSGKNFTFNLPDGSFLFIPSAFVNATLPQSNIITIAKGKAKELAKLP